MRTGTGPWGPGAASARTSTSGGPTVGSHRSYSWIRASPSGVRYASRIELRPSRRAKRAATSGWIGTRLRLAVLQRAQQRVLAADLIAAAVRLPSSLVLAGQPAVPAGLLQRRDDVAPRHVQVVQ